MCAIAILVHFWCIDMIINTLQLVNMSQNDCDKNQFDCFKFRIEMCFCEFGNECRNIPGRVVWLRAAPSRDK